MFVSDIPSLSNIDPAMTMARFFLSVLLALCAAAAAPAQQNVVLIIADDLGADYCGFHADAADTATMPTIRALADRGMVFNNAWAAPTCSPTRAGILTGRHSFRTGVGTALSGAEYPELDTAELTIPRLLRAGTPGGFATACVGKWHLNQRTPEKLNYPATFGYEYYSGNFLGEIPDYFNWNKVTNGVSSTCTAYATTQAVDDAISWLATIPGTKPFFLWVAFNAPHTPLHAPPASLHTVPGLTGAQGHINQNSKLYFKAMIEAMDTETGRLLRWLADNGRLDSTNVIFIGDNGNIKRVSQIADTTHGKGTLFEYGVRVPFLVAGPAVKTPGGASAALVSTVDLFATILELCGQQNWRDAIPRATPVDSRSIVPILNDREPVVRAWAFTEQFKPTPDASDGKAIRNAEYKLIRLDLGGESFYNLAADRNEAVDLLALGRPLTATEQSNYETLCNAMNELLGLTPCTGTVSVRGDASRHGPERGVTIFPNPSSARMIIGGLGTAHEAAYRLIAMDGREVSAGTLPVIDGRAVLTADLPAGRYLLAVRPAGAGEEVLAVDVVR